MKLFNLFFGLISAITLTTIPLSPQTRAQTHHPYSSENPRFSPHHKVAIEAIELCLGTAKRAIAQGSKKQPLISCDLPFAFKEHEMDNLIEEITKGKEKELTTNQPATKSKAAVKTLLNVTSADCKAKVRVKTSLIEEAIAKKNGELTIPDQWVSCALKTKAKQTKTIRFSFSPTGMFEQSCLKEFSPRMGKFNLDCTFCRLNILAQSLSYWVNKFGTRITPGINKALGKKCS